MYKPGLHILSEFESNESSLLSNFLDVKNYFEYVIEKYNLEKVGEVYYQFNNAGFTAVICLTESHISIHTWPENNRVTFDVFLSNYLKSNNETVEQIHNGLLDLLKAKNINISRLRR